MKKQTYIIRCAQAGVFYGEVAEHRESTGCADLVNVRRVHGWDGACSLSQLAHEGTKKHGGNNRWSVTVPKMTVSGVIEIIPVAETADAILKEMPVWKS